MADFKAFSPSSWKAFTKKCSELFPFLKKQYNMTQAEWDALSSSEKTAMAGQNVVITDDEGTQTFKEIIPDDASSTNKLVAESELAWHYTTIASNGDVAVPSSYNGFYEVRVFDAKKHIFFSGLRLGTDIAIGTVTTNFASMDNDDISLYENIIRVSRESIAGDYVVAYRPISASLIS